MIIDVFQVQQGDVSQRGPSAALRGRIDDVYTLDPTLCGEVRGGVRLSSCGGDEADTSGPVTLPLRGGVC